MKTNALTDAVADFKITQQNIATTNQEKGALETKIKETQAEIQKLEQQRDKLNLTIDKAADLMLAGKMTSTERTKSKKELRALQDAIDDQSELLSVFQNKLEGEHPVILRELNNELRNKQRLVNVALAQTLAAEVMEKCGHQVKELLAIIQAIQRQRNISNLTNWEEHLLELGAWLTVAAFGGTTNQPGMQNQDDKIQLISEVHKRIGL